MTDPDTKELLEKFGEMLKFVEVAERVRALVALHKYIGTEMLELVTNVDSDIQPEIEAAASHLALSSEALTRAFEFASARMSVRVEGGS